MQEITLNTNREIDIMLLQSGLDGEKATRMWTPLLEALRAKPGEFDVSFKVRDMPFRKTWDLDYCEKFDRSMVKADDLGGDLAGQLWWAGDSGQVSQFISGYFGRYLPVSLLRETDRYVDVLLRATKHSTAAVHINRGLAGAHPGAVARSRETSMNPSTLDAAGLFIIAGANHALPGLPGHDPDLPALRAARKKMKAAYDIIYAVTPGAGSHMNEPDFHDEHWASEYRGEHYQRLPAIKNR